MRFFRCFGGSGSRKGKQLVVAQTATSAGSFQVNGRCESTTGQVAPLCAVPKLDREEVCHKEDAVHKKDEVKVGEVKVEFDLKETPLCENKEDGGRSDTAVQSLDREAGAVQQILLVGRHESLSLGVYESSPEKERVVAAAAYVECGDGAEYLEDAEYDVEEADGDVGHGDRASEDSSGSVRQDEHDVLLLVPAVPAETELYYGTACDGGSAGSGPLEQTECKSEGGAEAHEDKDPAGGDHGGGHVSDPEAYLQKWNGVNRELGVSCGISPGRRSDDGSRERVSELSSNMERRSGFHSSKSHAAVEDYHRSDSEQPSGPACGDTHSIPEHSVNLSWMGSEAPKGGSRLVSNLFLSSARGKTVSWWKSSTVIHGEGATVSAQRLEPWGRGSSEQGYSRSKVECLAPGGYDTEGENSEWGVGRTSPTSDSALIPKRVAELKGLGTAEFGMVGGWVTSDSSRKETGTGELPSSGSAVSQFNSATGTPNTGELMPEEGACERFKTLRASDLVGREKSATPWVAEWMSRLEPEAESLDMVAEGTSFDWPSPKNELLRKRSMSVGAGMDTMAGLSRSHPGTEAAAGPVLDGDLEVAAALVRSMEVGVTAAIFSGRGLKVAPGLCHFANLKTIDLSKNSIVRMPAGCLPKSLQHLDLSHNKLTAVEGLRDLSRLRTLKLSSNRITRIGHGLSGCSALRELYLSDNKVSEVEGLHRLLKLLIVDISFNKITTTKALGQLAANYSSMQAINLAGNPVVANLGDDQFRRFMLGLVPHLVFLNKQPIAKGAVASRSNVSSSSTKEHAHKAHAKSLARSAAGGARSVPGHKRVSSGSGGGSSSRSHKHAHGGGVHHAPSPSTTQLAALEAAAMAVSETSHRRHGHQHRSHHHSSSEERGRSGHRTMGASSGLPPPPPPKAAAAAAAAATTTTAAVVAQEMVDRA